MADHLVEGVQDRRDAADRAKGESEGPADIFLGLRMYRWQSCHGAAVWALGLFVPAGTWSKVWQLAQPVELPRRCSLGTGSVCAGGDLLEHGLLGLLL